MQKLNARTFAAVAAIVVAVLALAFSLASLVLTLDSTSVSDLPVGITAAMITAIVALTIWAMTGRRDRQNWLRDQRLALYADMVASVYADLDYLRNFTKSPPNTEVAETRPGDRNPLDPPENFARERATVAARARILAAPRVLDEFEFAAWPADTSLSFQRGHLGSKQHEQAERVAHVERALVDLEWTIKDELSTSRWSRPFGRSPSSPPSCPPSKGDADWARTFHQGQEEEHAARREAWRRRDEPVDYEGLIAQDQRDWDHVEAMEEDAWRERQAKGEPESG